MWDRYDFDEDGNFDEADGYIDHFQAVHAGEGEEAGADPDAIWSHRWYAYPTTAGSEGPSIDGKPNLNGGARIGDTNYFIGDYTVEPENGGLGVFAHEYGHDLGLPDFYDTNGGDNGTSFWTTMSSGSWLGHGGADEGIGTHPGSFGPEEKLFLGWLKYTEVDKGAGTRSITLSPSEKQVDGAYQAVKVNLPTATTTQAQVDIPGGDYAWWSGRGDELRNTLTRDVPAAELRHRHGRRLVRHRAGLRLPLRPVLHRRTASTWTTIGRGLTGTQHPLGRPPLQLQGGRPGHEVPVPLRHGRRRERDRRVPRQHRDQGRPDHLHRRRRDRGHRLGGQGLEALDRHRDGHRTTATTSSRTGSTSATTPRWRRARTTSPRRSPEPNWVEFFKFQDGMLVWLVDPTAPDNNTSVHPGSGYALPVDATPNSFTYSDGTSPTNRREPFDATFGLDVIDPTCLHKQVAADKGRLPTWRPARVASRSRRPSTTRWSRLLRRGRQPAELGEGRRGGRQGDRQERGRHQPQHARGRHLLRRLATATAVVT